MIDIHITSMFVILIMNIQIVVKSQEIGNYHTCPRSGIKERDIDFLLDINKIQSREIADLRNRVEELEKEKIDSKTGPANDINQIQTHAGQFGKEFYLSFPMVRGTVHKIEVLIVSLETTLVQITSNIPNINRVVAVGHDSGERITLVDNLVEEHAYEGNNSVRLEAQSMIAVTVIQTSQNGTGDGYMAVPTTQVTDKYLFSSNHRGQLSVLAIYDDTIINVKVNNGYAFWYNGSVVGKGEPVNYTLNSMEMIQLTTPDGYAMGTVQGSLPFMFVFGSYSDALFTTHEASYVSAGSVRYGQEFIIPKLSSRSKAIVICNADEDISANSTEDITEKGNYIFLTPVERATFIKTNVSVMCKYIGHGFASVIPSVSSFTNYSLFITPSASSYSHHAAVLIKENDIDNFLFRKINKPIINNFTFTRESVTTFENINYLVLYYDLPKGVFEVYHERSDVRFCVISFGFSLELNANYAYPTGFISRDSRRKHDIEKAQTEMEADNSFL